LENRSESLIYTECDSRNRDDRGDDRQKHLLREKSLSTKYRMSSHQMADSCISESRICSSIRLVDPFASFFSIALLLHADRRQHLLQWSHMQLTKLKGVQTQIRSCMTA
jgi:hypothetical protein